MTAQSEGAATAAAASPAAASQPPREGLFRLPPEIREHIYREIFWPANNRQHFENGYMRYAFDLRVMRTNRQMYYEARGVLRRVNAFVVVQTPWPEAERHIAGEGFVPVLVSGEAAQRFDAQHLTVDIGSPHYRLAGQAQRRFVLHLDNLRDFCQTWFYSDMSQTGLNALLRLVLQLRDPYAASRGDDSSSSGGGGGGKEGSIPTELQRRLLEPFGLLRGLQEVVVEGPHAAAIEQAMREDMLEPYTPPEECLEAAERLKEAGNNALRRGQYIQALQLYRESFRAIHIVIDGRRRSIWADAFFQCEIPTGALKGQHAQLVRLALRVKLVANTVQALLKLDRVDDAHFWGMRSITLMREAVEGEEPVLNFVAAESMGKIYYRTALACQRLKETEKDEEARKQYEADARHLLFVANQYLPRDEIVRKELEKFQLRIG